jgi:diacylglycerol kinase
MWIHLCIATATIALGLVVRLPLHDWLAIVIAIALVIVSETLNTATECLGDAITDQPNQQIGLAKDAGAAAVLLASVAAATIGLIVFLPYLWRT